MARQPKTNVKGGREGKGEGEREGGSIPKHNEHSDVSLSAKWQRQGAIRGDREGMCRVQNTEGMPIYPSAGGPQSDLLTALFLSHKPQQPPSEATPPESKCAPRVCFC